MKENQPATSDFKRLFEHGWLPGATFAEALQAVKDNPALLRLAIQAYQGFHGLAVDGVCNQPTKRSLEAFRFCAHPDVMPIQEEINRWPNPNINYYVDEQSMAGLSIRVETVLAAVDWGWNEWRLVCGINPMRTPDRAKAQVVIAFGGIDGAGKVLAFSELADNSQRAKGQKYDSSESWDFAAQPARYKIDLGRVACHEIGHMLGIPHITAGNLLQPTYDVNIRSPQKGDINEAQSRYGPPLAPPVPPPVPPPAGTEFMVTMKGRGQIEDLVATGFKITRV